MLTHLYIKNYTLIDLLDISFHEGFSVITGETGAGKSIILGAIGLLLGNRADSKAIKPGCDRCVIEAQFDLSRYELEDFFLNHDIDYCPADTIIRRELTSAGKSRAFVNDTPVPLATMRELGETLVDIHSQHQNLLLQKEDFQLQVVDIIAGDKRLSKDHAQAFLAYQRKERELRAAKEEARRQQDNEDYLRYQYNELEQAQLQAGEQAQVEQETQAMTHAEDIKSALYTACNALNGDEGGAIASLREASRQLQSIGQVYPQAQSLLERLDSCDIELKDIADDLSQKMERVDFDPALLEKLNARLDTLYALQRKYHVEDEEQLIALRDNLARQLDQLEHGEENIAMLAAEVEKLLQDCEEKAQLLTETRQQAAQKVAEEMRQRLIPLGMPRVRFEVKMEQKPLSVDGKDKISFLFSANTGTPAMPVSQIASGGEIARVMLSLKAMISGTIKLPTIIFDEIDTGVSGSIAERMAHIMREMGAANRQVISITHLPQIAALGSHHYKVAKQETAQGTVSVMKELTPEERVAEIAGMLSGSDVTEAALANARTLLKTEN